jgi:thioredoxin 1
MSPKITSFGDLIRMSDKPVLVDFWAEWCAPCRTVSLIIARIAKEYRGRVMAVKVNVDKKSQIASQYDIRSIPTIMMFWQGQPIMRVTGALSYQQLKEQIDYHLPAMS